MVILDVAITACPADVVLDVRFIIPHSEPWVEVWAGVCIVWLELLDEGGELLICNTEDSGCVVLKVGRVLVGFSLEITGRHGRGSEYCLVQVSRSAALPNSACVPITDY